MSKKQKAENYAKANEVFSNIFRMRQEGEPAISHSFIVGCMHGILMCQFQQSSLAKQNEILREIEAMDRCHELFINKYNKA